MKNWNQIITTTALGLTPKGVSYVQGVAPSPPSRNPSNATRTNLIVDLVSQKMGHTHAVESLTIEAAYAQMMEIALDCIGYWPQPAKLPIFLTGRDGIKRTVWVTFDFLVLFSGRVELVECKPEAKLIELNAELPGRYHRNESGRWTSPEVEAALVEYGIQFRVVSSAELNVTLLRNYTLLQEARQDDYSTPNALPKVLNLCPKDGEGVPLSELIQNTGSGFTKNDVYFGILRGDLHVLLSDCLLVDTKTTRVFAKKHHAEVFRLRNFETKPLLAKTLVLKTGARLRWNGTAYTVCNASAEQIYMRSKDIEPTPFPRRLLCSLIANKEIDILDTEAAACVDRAETLRRYGKDLTPEVVAKARRKTEFLEFLKRHPNARSEDFGLEQVKLRTVQSWKSAAHQSVQRYGTPFWGLLDQPRPGRPRDDLPAEMRAEMTAIAEELYFTPEGRSATYVWRELRRRREARKLRVPSRGAFKRHIEAMKNQQDTTAAREGDKASYKYGSTETVGYNWITAGDFPLKVGQMDGKTWDIEVVDDETGESLGKPTLTLLTLPHYGSAPVGWALLLEPESYRSATMAIRDLMERFGEPVKFLIVDNGKAFNNGSFDTLLGTLDITKIDRVPADPRFASEIESIFATVDREVIHNRAGNTKPTQNVKEMSAEMDPKKSAVWTFSALYDSMEKYLFELLWDAPAASLGTAPRNAYERDQRTAPDRASRFIIPPDLAKIAYLPEADGRTRLVQPGRGIFVEGYYYWNPLMKQPAVENSSPVVRYDPFEIKIAYAAIDGNWVECINRRAPELRNVTERVRRRMCAVRRRLKNNHAQRRDETHGRRLAEHNAAMLADEKLQREMRRARAQQHAVNSNRRNPETPVAQNATPTNGKVGLPEIDFSHLQKTA